MSAIVKPAGRYLNLISLKELRESEFAKREWVIYPFAKEGSSIMLYGRQGCGKSSASVQLIESLTTGKPWLGFEVRKTGKVIYLQVDMSQAETLTLFERADVAGLAVDAERLAYPIPLEGEEHVEFNVLDPAQARELAEWVAYERPVAVIVDTIADAFESEGKIGVNEEIRRALKNFQQAIGPAVLVFLQHERKKPPAFGKRKGEDDPDAFMGGTAFEAKIATSLQLAAQEGEWVLNIRKCRLAPPPAGQIKLKKDEHGFFYVPPNDHAFMLVQWPHCIQDDVERAAVIAAATTKTAVFADIARRSGSSFDAVKKAFERGRNNGVVYPWLALLEGK